MTKLLLGSMKKFTLTIKEFPIHVEKTDNKFAPNKFIKINNQSIYNGAINRFTRNTVVKNLHKFILSKLPDIQIEDYPLKVTVIIRTVMNHGSISRRKGKTIWKKPEADYEPNWDEDNLTGLWVKVIRDSLTLKGMIVDDNVKYIRGGETKIEFVETLEEREMIIKIQRI